MPRPRWTHLPAARQDPILDAAAAEFIANGYAEASYNRIIAAAGVSKGSMYYYFDDKEDLFVAVVARSLAPLGPLAALPDAVTDADAFWATLWSRADAALPVLIERPDLAKLGRAIYECFRTAKPGGPLGGLLTDVDAWTDHAIGLGQSVGAVRDDLPRPMLARVTVAALMAADQWITEAWETLEPAQLPALTHASMQMIRAMLQPPR